MIYYSCIYAKRGVFHLAVIGSCIYQSIDGNFKVIFNFRKQLPRWDDGFSAVEGVPTKYPAILSFHQL